jgi:hypothetical protein
MANDAESAELPPSLALAFAPLHKRAFGIALGTAAGLTVALVTLIYLAWGNPPDINLGLLRAYFWGYRANWSGVLVGLWWGFVAGFVAGWFLAFCRNAIIAISVFLIRTRSQLSNTRDFLDHI